MITFHLSTGAISSVLMDVLTFTLGPKGKLRFGDEKYERKDKTISSVRQCEEKYEGS